MSITAFTGFINIDDHGLLLIQGPDAKKFLQGQVTCDIDQLKSGINGVSTLGAHCTPKGRMLFSFRAFAMADDTIALNIYKPLIQEALTALKKYSIFSKVDIIDASDEYRILGFSDTDDSAKASMATLPTTINHSITDSQGTIIAIGDHHYEYYLDKLNAEQLLVEYPATAASHIWEAVNIRAGIGEVKVETVDMFIPQMLNYQAIGTGISFSKGCYTGQEVVARMQYRGKLKRRLFRFSIESDQALIPGMPLFTQDSTQSIGNIVSSAESGQSQELLAVVTEQAVIEDKVYLDPDGMQKLQQEPLPYAIPKE